ncbi:PREDICTED: large subunit GTPase 1 homolog isoform X1 [Amphimedon queenslandica]|uniref:Large subunit GTPase 1 homolog n=2 Tax=Amphimedon queenslandica TaxID=400682 RepID=A0A1X7V8D6_AMPQE|nr:PREDICTED: large subunit GTPase 1 homolog isoform X1 [Amphimedon queenslandica]|eukprot:XP_003385333.1 PREDICTED: large subunit GTPase 1 homolog isoform X1 [Amphimedon queenslandica]
MAKSKGQSGLGKALLKNRRRGRKGGGGEEWLHTSELSDGYEWGRLNVASVTEENSLDEFLRTAELAGTEFTAEKLNISVVMDAEKHTGLPGAEEKREIKEIQEKFKQDLRIPRRPRWDKDTTPEELEQRERDGFIEWRRHLATLEEREKIILTPFERNLEFWRQLWRVIERSDVVVQIVDARNPLLFYCEDLDQYVKEADPSKVNMLLMSKSDLLTDNQRKVWSEYLKTQRGFEAVGFWSAKVENEDIEQSEGTSPDEGSPPSNNTSEKIVPEPTDVRGVAVGGASADTSGPALLTRTELIELFMSLAPSDKRPVTIGLVGYPNVGKSSTINALMGTKRVPVSATPGRTKHFQTLHVNEDVILCDCPGLVFPNFISTKAQLIINGILPIDQMRDHVPPVSLVCQKVPGPVLERCYGIRIQPPLEGEDPRRPPFSHELLSPYAYSRGFMTSHGQPDQSRAARYILKDFVNGKILYCEAPPGTDPVTFNEHLLIADTGMASTSAELESDSITDTPNFDHSFFSKREGIVHSKGVVGVSGGHKTDDKVGSDAKPWKKHHNHKKKEKTRRIVKDETPYNYY